MLPHFWALQKFSARSQVLAIAQKIVAEIRPTGWRWSVESFFSGLKRTMGDALAARRPQQMLAEAAFNILAYTLRR